MKKWSKNWTVLILLFLLVPLLLFGIFANDVDAYVSVKGYYRKDGTYVRPHVRSNPNGLKYDNYGYSGGDLYNDSYGTRGSSWDTPTYITDPDYYEGKALYESGGYSPSSSSESSNSKKLTKSLFVGMSDTEVRTIQSYLSKDSSIYPEKIISGYFGKLTEKAVRRFQTKYGIRQTGIFDKLTRDKFNSLYALGTAVNKNINTNVATPVKAVSPRNNTTVPANAYASGSTWYCKTGYKTIYNNSVQKTGCELK